MEQSSHQIRPWVKEERQNSGSNSPIWRKFEGCESKSRQYDLQEEENWEEEKMSKFQQQHYKMVIFSNAIKKAFMKSKHKLNI